MKSRHFLAEHLRSGNRLVAFAIFYLTLLTATFAFKAESARAGVDLGVRNGLMQLSAVGYSNRTYSVSSAKGIDLNAPISRNISTNVYFESSGQEYTFGGIGLPYFPLSYSTKQESADGIARVTYDDIFKPFVGSSFGFGRLRLRSLNSIVQAQEIGTAFSSIDITAGFFLHLISIFSLGIDASYGKVSGTSDSPVTFAGSRTTMHVGVYLGF